MFSKQDRNYRLTAQEKIKEFQSRNGCNCSFQDNDMQSYDGIYITVYEFIVPDTLQSIANFLSDNPKG